MEAAIVLGVVGLVIGGIWVTASAVSEKSNVNRYVSDVLTIINNARAYGNANVWTGGVATALSVNDELQHMGIAPSSWLTADAYLRDPYFGYTLYIRIDNTNALSRPRFQLEIEDQSANLPRARCMAITSALYTALKNEQPVRTTVPYSNVMLVNGLSSVGIVEPLTPAANSFVSNNPCTRTGNPWLITLFPLY